MIDWTRVKRELGKLRLSDVIILPLTWFVGWWYIFLVIRYRAYARNIVYNYVLQNKRRDLLSRLWQHGPQYDSTRGGWALYPANGHALAGFVKRRKVSTLRFYLVVLFLWGWLDDDSVSDTTDKGYIQTIVSGSRKTDIVGRLFASRLANVNLSQATFGSTFDLGDIRAEKPFYNALCTFLWTWRNTCMNFKYLFQNY